MQYQTFILVCLIVLQHCSTLKSCPSTIKQERFQREPQHKRIISFSFLFGKLNRVQFPLNEGFHSESSFDQFLMRLVIFLKNYARNIESFQNRLFQGLKSVKQNIVVNDFDYAYIYYEKEHQ